MMRKLAQKINFLFLDNESGVVIVWVALLMVVLLSFAAMAIDIGHLMVVRNELQNAADAAALAGAQYFYPSLTPKIPNWTAAETQAINSIQLNKSDGVTLVDGVVQSGYWNLSGSPLGLQAKGITPENLDYPAVMVQVSRGDQANGGPVVNFFASIMGIGSSSVSAQAVAICASPGVAYPGAIFPIAISKEMAEQADKYNSSGKTFKIGSSYHYPNSMAGQWTSLSLDRNDVPTIRDLIANGNPTALNIGDNIWIEPGTKTSLYKDVPVGKNVLLPIVNAVLRDTTHAEVPIYGFIGFHITNSDGGSGKYIEGYFLPNFYSGLSGPAGPNYGVYVPSKLVQ